MSHWSPLLLMVLACGSSSGPAAQGDDPDDSGGQGPLDTAGADTGGADTATDFDDCTPGSALAVTAFEATEGPIGTQFAFDIELNAPASVAVQCTSDTDPTQIFFTEAPQASTTHSLRLQGLVPSTEFTCTVAPVCPTPVAEPASLALSSGPPPDSIAGADMEQSDHVDMVGAWTLAPYSRGLGQITYLVVWGPDGTARWWTALPRGIGVDVEALWDEDARELVWGGGNSPDGYPRVWDLWDGEVDAWRPNTTDDAFHHDGKRLADGRWLTLEIRDNQAAGDRWDGFGIRLHDPVTDDTFEIDSQRYVDEGWLFAPFTDDNDDPWHANWVDITDTDDGPEIVVSLCFAWQIMGLDGITGDARWLLGRGIGWTVLDETGQPLSEDALPQCQHGLEVSEDRTLLVYDNGQYRAQSSVAMWKVDPATWSVQRLWTWTEPGWSEPFLGDADYLSDDHVLVTQASFSNPSDIVEVDRATGEVASRLTLRGGALTYRAERYDGCELFDAVADCAPRRARYEELAPLLVP